MTDPKPTTLYSYRSDGQLSLEEAIAKCQPHLEGTIALLYSPNACQFLRLINGEFKDSHSRKINNLTDVFEARVFTEYCELRWLNREHGKGDAVLLTEDLKLTENLKSIDGFQEAKQQIKDTLIQKYLLWGEPVLNPQDIQDGWQRLAEARIGKLNIPISNKLSDKKQRVYLHTREYIDTLEYGNCVVVEERLLKLEAVKL